MLVLSVLLCGCETWKMTMGEEKKLDIFQTKSLRRIFYIRWQQHVANKEVLDMAGADPISKEVRRKRWCWIGLVLKKEVNSNCAVALGWKPEGKRSRGRPKITWRYSEEKERETDKDGTHGQERGTQQTTATAVEGRCSDLVCLLAQGDLTLTFVYMCTCP